MRTWEDGTQCKDLGKVRNNVEDLVELRGNLNLKWGSGGLLLVGKINNVQGFHAKKFKTKKARNKRNNKVGKDTEYRTIIMMRGQAITMENKA